MQRFVISLDEIDAGLVSRALEIINKKVSGQLLSAYLVRKDMQRVFLCL